jgi:glucosamine kinase
VTSPRRVVAIDGGKSKTYVALAVDGHVTRRTRGPGLEMVTVPGGLRAVREALSASLDAVADQQGLGRLDAVCIGLNGVHAPSREAEQVAGLLRDLVAADRVVVTSDMVTTYCGALGLVPGAVVAAGTGSIAMGLSEHGQVTRVDGWGYLLGDEGSGYAIGLRGLRSALRAVDGRAGSQRLLSLAAARFGGVGEIVRAVYGSEVPARVVASFSRDVADAAAQGDLEAVAIWSDAGQELARTVVAATTALTGPAPTTMSWAGGLFDVGALLLDPFVEQVRRLAPSATLRPPAADALTGGLMLASQPAPVLPSVTLWAPSS